MPTIHYFWDEIEGNVVEEYDDSGNTIANYTTEPTMSGSALSQDRSGEVRHYQFDGQGNTTELTDANGNITDTYHYDAFGDVIARSGNTTNRYGFKVALGFYAYAAKEYYVRARIHRAVVARWISADPIACLGDLYLYTFVLNGPLTLVDPSGL